MDYSFSEIEKKWRVYWAEKKTFSVHLNKQKPKFYVLDMFPYPSGSGLHVGHPLGYIASDIYSRYKRLKGFNVLHPMGYDAFGLPAEQYAIQTGQHPSITTEQNIKRYREQLDNMGFAFDWDREVRTSDPSFYKWTQWIFIKLFNSWYNPEEDKAEPIEMLIHEFAKSNSQFTNGSWNTLNEIQREEILQNYRLAYLSNTMVNWCAGLGTVLANEEVKDGLSERGGFPVERKLMKQWSLRIMSYADRLLQDLDTIDWHDSIKDAQRNWIGKSSGSSLKFKIKNSESEIEVFTTRPDTIFGATFLVLAPEHELINSITSTEQKGNTEKYLAYCKHRSERERQAEIKKISGQFTGAYAIHPFTKKEIPIWIGEYVLAGYGTGAIMAVPAHDSRDYAFANHFGLEIIEVVEGGDLTKEAFEAKDGTLVNSDFLNGLKVKEAIQNIISKIEEKKIGRGQINFRLRDAIFSRQRYWGEPFPVYYKDGIPHVLGEKELPVELPPVDKYLPTETGEPPLARAKGWHTKNGFTPEYNTMPGWAGSSWYFLRFMDPKNKNEFVSQEAVNYWQDVDLYIGGAEHATGHLLYFRFWTKFLFDLGLIPINEPAKKLINQGMILGRSLLLWQGFFENEEEKSDTTIRICSYEKIPEKIERNGKVYKNIGKMHYRTIIQFADEKDRLTESKFSELKKNEIIFSDLDLNEKVIWETDKHTGERFVQLSPEVEKMSKSKFNIVNPDDIIEQYGADTLRMYEMFLGPLEQHKPWNTNGITGVHNFLKKYWRLFHKENQFSVSEESATKAELKSLHKIIKKAEEDIERFSFNTSVSAFMICVNELTDLKCNKRPILEQLTILLSPYAPHIAEEIWQKLGHTSSIADAKFPILNAEYLTEDSFEYPVSFNGKTKCNINLPFAFTKEEVEKAVLESAEVKRFLHDLPVKKIIVVHGRIVNIVV